MRQMRNVYILIGKSQDEEDSTMQMVNEFMEQIP
jgi:hypothetical protein